MGKTDGSRRCDNNIDHIVIIHISKSIYMYINIIKRLYTQNCKRSRETL